VFHLSIALGAFFAGLVVGRSRLGPQAGAYMTPFRDVFSALFFVSVGMLLDPRFPFEHPLKVLAAIAIVLVAKPVVALLIVKILRDRPGTAQTVAVGLAQIGEFSFLLGTLGVSYGLLPQEGLDTLVAVAIISIALNPLLFNALSRWEHARAAEQTDAEQRSVTAPASAIVGETLKGHIILTGEGPLQRGLLKRMREEAIDVVVIDPDIDHVDDLTRKGAVALFGDAARTDVLRAAGATHAAAIVVTSQPLSTKMAVCLSARQVNPSIAIVAAAQDPTERAWLIEFGVTACDTTRSAVEELQRALEEALAHR
jgi:CPA2 family monovalent cation:H+ antiporter-2